MALARALLAHGGETILVITQTNHALDQFLEAILDSGYASSHMLRVGGRSASTRIEALSVHRALERLQAPGAARASMFPHESAQNYALGQEITAARELLEHLCDRDGALVAEQAGDGGADAAIDWRTPARVPLCAVQDIIEVCSVILGHGLCDARLR